MNTILSTTISLLIGSVIVVNGISVKAEDLIASAKTAANGANVHQLATVIELYYSDHDSYPKVTGGEELVNTLYNEGYIMSKPLDSNDFDYEYSESGQNYKLALSK